MTPRQVKQTLQRGHRASLSSNRKAELRAQLLEQLESEQEPQPEADISYPVARRKWPRVGVYGYSAAGLLLAGGIAGAIALTLPGANAPQSLAKSSTVSKTALGANTVANSTGQSEHTPGSSSGNNTHDSTRSYGLQHASKTTRSAKPSQAAPHNTSGGAGRAPVTGATQQSTNGTAAQSGSGQSTLVHQAQQNTSNATHTALKSQNAPPSASQSKHSLLQTGKSSKQTQSTGSTMKSSGTSKIKQSTGQSTSSNVQSNAVSSSSAGHPKTVNPKSNANTQTTGAKTSNRAQTSTNTPAFTAAQTNAATTQSGISSNAANGTDTSENDTVGNTSSSGQVSTQMIAPNGTSPTQTFSSTPGSLANQSNSTTPMTAMSGATAETNALAASATPAQKPFIGGTWAIKGNYVYRTSDGGKSWVDVTPVDVVHSDAIITTSEFVNPEEGAVAVRQSGQSTVFTTDDGGQTWQDMNFPTDASDVVREIDLLDDSIGFAAVTNSGASNGSFSLWETVDGGQQWAKMSTSNNGLNSAPTASQLYAQTPIMSFASANDGYRWAETGNGPAVAYTTDAGASWSTGLPALPAPKSVPSGATRNVLSLPSFFSGVGVWPVLYQSPLGNTLVIYKSVDQGLTWTVSESASVLSVNSAVFVSPTVGWAVDPASNTLLQTSDGGKTWISVTSSVAISSLSLIVPTNATSALAIEQQSDGTTSVVQTTDGGKTWHAASAPQSFVQVPS